MGYAYKYLDFSLTYTGNPQSPAHLAKLGPWTVCCHRFAVSCGWGVPKSRASSNASEIHRLPRLLEYTLFLLHDYKYYIYIYLL